MNSASTDVVRASSRTFFVVASGSCWNTSTLRLGLCSSSPSFLSPSIDALSAASKSVCWQRGRSRPSARMAGDSSCALALEFFGQSQIACAPAIQRASPSHEPMSDPELRKEPRLSGFFLNPLIRLSRKRDWTALQPDAGPQITAGRRLLLGRALWQTRVTASVAGDLH
jgi:hypothetical protein